MCDKYCRPKKSHFANHFFDNPDHIHTDEFNMLLSADKGLKLNTLESLDINKCKFEDVLLNEQIHLDILPLLNFLS